MALVASVLPGRPAGGRHRCSLHFSEYHVVLRPRRYLAARAGCMGLSRLARASLSPMMMKTCELLMIRFSIGELRNSHPLFPCTRVGFQCRVSAMQGGPCVFRRCIGSPREA